MADSKFVPAGGDSGHEDKKDRWAEAEATIQENRRKLDESQQEKGKSLYETLQANKGD